MTELLQRAIAEMEKLPSVQQDAIASRILSDLEDEQEWTVRFEATTDEQWKRMVEAVRGEIAAGNNKPVQELKKKVDRILDRVPHRVVPDWDSVES